jgi:hypothetical protein
MKSVNSIEATQNDECGHTYPHAAERAIWTQGFTRLKSRTEWFCVSRTLCASLELLKS